jgi:hypothetical protein
VLAAANLFLNAVRRDGGVKSGASANGTVHVRETAPAGPKRCQAEAFRLNSARAAGPIRSA